MVVEGGDNTSKTDNQEQSTAKLVMGAFYRVVNNRGVTAEDVTMFLKEKFGDIWKTSVLTAKANEALAMSVALGFLHKEGDRYLVNVQRPKGRWGMSSYSRRRNGAGVTKRRPRSKYS